MNDREYALDRAKKVLGGGNRPALVQPNFIKWSQGTIEAVYCRTCGCEIKHWIETDTPPLKVHRQNGTSTIHKMFVLAELGNYQEITLQFDDGSEHVTHCCRGCVDKLTESDLRAMYAADLLQVDKECTMFNVKDFPWRLWAYRHVVRWSRN